MKIVNFLAALLVSVLVFTSCDKEDGGLGIAQETAAEGYATVRLADSSSASSAKTRAGSSQGTLAERKLNVIEFYIFNPNGNRDTEKDSEGNDTGVARYVRIDPVQSANDEYTFAVTAGSNKAILVAANMDLGRLDNLSSLAEVRKKIYDTQIESPLSVPSDGIPMAGETTISILEEQVVRTEITVSRLFSRFNAPTAEDAEIDLTVKEIDSLQIIWGEKPLLGQIEFELKRFYVINGLNQSFAFENYGVSSEYDRWDSNTWTIGQDVNNYFTSVYDSQGGLVEAYSGNDFLTNEPVYVYENSAYRTTVDGVRGFDSRTVYSFIIEGVLSDSGSDAECTRYWRVNVAKTGEKETIYQILRNAIYNVDIKNVRTLGYGTPEEAEEGGGKVIPDVDEAAIIALISVADWRVFNEGADI